MASTVAIPTSTSISGTEAEYLRFTSSTSTLVEFTDGRIELLPMPTTSHQRILRLLFTLLSTFVNHRSLGEVLFAALRVKVRDGKYREPDIVFMSEANRHRVTDEFWIGADLVVEIVSKDGEVRDWEEKRLDYAEGNIPEYWIVDPLQSRVVVLKLVDGAYATHSEATATGNVSSALLDGFHINIAELFAAANPR